jgi:hypothetical protein
MSNDMEIFFSFCYNTIACAYNMFTYAEYRR